MFTIPGEYVGTPEEYEKGFGTYEENGKIYSSNTGKLKLNKKRHQAEVRSKTRIPKMQSPGTVVLGKVTRSDGQIVEVELVPFESKTFTFIPNSSSAILHVSNISDEYIDDVKEKFRVGDIVRVKITGVSKDTVELATDQANLGVLKGYCPKCRTPMKKIGIDKLKCPQCSYVDTRKTTKDYGEGKLK